MTFFPDQKGFTLIEIIIVIVILGILGTAGSIGLKQVMDGYTLAQAMATSTQKAQIALDRIAIELAHITYNSGLLRYNISSGGTNSITYTANFGGTDENHIIDQNADKVRIDNTAGTKFTLTDGVVTTGLQFKYLDGDGITVVAATNTGMRLIEVALTVRVHPTDSTVTRTFTARVALQS